MPDPNLALADSLLLETAAEQKHRSTLVSIRTRCSGAFRTSAAFHSGGGLNSSALRAQTTGPFRVLLSGLCVTLLLVALPRASRLRSRQPVNLHEVGTLVKWNTKKGFGFIKPNRGNFYGDEHLFCHVRNMVSPTVKEGDVVTFYRQYSGRSGKDEAVDVEPVPAEAEPESLADPERAGLGYFGPIGRIAVGFVCGGDAGGIGDIKFIRWSTSHMLDIEEDFLQKEWDQMKIDADAD